MNRPGEPDPSLRRIERDAAIACAVMAAIALAVQGGRINGAVGVLGGGALMAFSHRAIRSGVNALAGRAVPASGAGAAQGRPSVARALAAFIGRYAVIGVAAWLLLAKLRAHPVGLLAGVTAPVAAMTLEALRRRRR